MYIKMWVNLKKIKFDFWIVIYFDKFVINYLNEGS